MKNSTKGIIDRLNELGARFEKAEATIKHIENVREAEIKYFENVREPGTSKGQLISKCLFGFFNSPIKRTKTIRLEVQL